MLTQEEVKRYAHMRRLKLIDQIWKDYLQDMLLHLLYRKMPRMVFGGGTCLWKVMRGDRFSEDIDAFESPVPKDLADYLKKELAFLGISCSILKQKRTANMVFIKLAISLPSHPRKIPVSLEILSNRPESVPVTLYSPYPDIPPVEMLVLPPEETLANKVSAVYGRNKARDVHDIYLLLKQGTWISAARIRKKVRGFSLKTFEKKILDKRAEWKSLGPLIVTKLPALEEEKEFIISRFREAFGE